MVQNCHYLTPSMIMLPLVKDIWMLQKIMCSDATQLKCLVTVEEHPVLIDRSGLLPVYHVTFGTHLALVFSCDTLHAQNTGSACQGTSTEQGIKWPGQCHGEMRKEKRQVAAQPQFSPWCTITPIISPSGRVGPCMVVSYSPPQQWGKILPAIPAMAWVPLVDKHCYENNELQ